jgi:hypothetical protein
LSEVRWAGQDQVATYEDWGWLHQAGNSGWRVAAVADFDGNGTPDLVYQQTGSPYAVTVNYYGPVWSERKKLLSRDRQGGYGPSGHASRRFFEH